MKKILLSLLLLCAISAYAQDKRISVFTAHIEDVATQKKLSFKEAAKQVFDAGVTGVDVPVNIKADRLQVLDEIGFNHSCAVANIDFRKGDMEKEMSECLKFMAENSFDRVLVVFGSKDKKASTVDDGQLHKRVQRFVKLASDEGRRVMVENEGDSQSPCYNTSSLDKMFAAVPSLGYVFDTGNCLRGGDDITDVENHFYGKIKHVHLKDCKSAEGQASTALGDGVVPIGKVVKRMLATGYKGWFTIECFGVDDMLAAIQRSVATVNASYDEFSAKYPRTAEMNNAMTENWTPQPKKVTPGDAASLKAPSDAIVLFDGTNLDEWQKSDGSAAGWDVHDGVMTVNKPSGDIVTKRKFGSYQLHLEWKCPENISGESQSRGNSGVFMQDMYEVQILDSYDNDTYAQGCATSIYKQTGPLVNATKKPGEWNVYDIIYTAPVFKEDGTYLYRPYITILHNGIIVQNHTEIYGTTEFIGLPRTVVHGDGPIRLQAHGDPSEPISFRNIWIRPL